MTSPRRSSVLFSADRDRQLRAAGIRAWSIVGIVAVAVVGYMGFSTFSTFILPLIVAVVLGMIFEPVASLLARVMPRQVAALLVLVGIGLLAVALGAEEDGAAARAGHRASSCGGLGPIVTAGAASYAVGMR
jgi:hypothetical protein